MKAFSLLWLNMKQSKPRKEPRRNMNVASSDFKVEPKAVPLGSLGGTLGTEAGEGSILKVCLYCKSFDLIEELCCVIFGVAFTD